MDLVPFAFIAHSWVVHVGKHLNLEVGADRGKATSQFDSATALFPPPGMEAGPPGPPGLPAAPLAGSASRCASGPAATPRPGTAAGCVWGRTARKGTCLSAPSIAVLTLHCHSSAVGFSAALVLDQVLKIGGITFCWAELSSFFLTSLYFDRSPILTASLGCYAP